MWDSTSCSWKLSSRKRKADTTARTGPTPRRPIVHLRGFCATPGNDCAVLAWPDVIEAADMVNGEYLAAAMAASQTWADPPPTGVLLAVHLTGMTAPARREVLARSLEAVCAWTSEVNAAGIVVTPDRESLSAVSLAAGGDQDSVRSILEDLAASEIRQVLAASPRIARRLDVNALSAHRLDDDEALMALGRRELGESVTSILAGPSAGDVTAMVERVARIPVPHHLFERYLQALAAAPASGSDVGIAFEVVNASRDELGLRGLRQTDPAVESDVPTTILAASLAVRARAMEAALRDQELGPMMMRLRDYEADDRVLALAAIAPVDPDIGGSPAFLPDFREGLENVLMSLRSAQG